MKAISSATLPFHFILDNAGNPYILFSHRTWSGLNWTEEIIFAEKGASTWTQTQLAQYPMAVFQGMSLTRDSKGNFHAFVSGEQQIIHFTRQAGTWTQETIENNSQIEYLSADITPADVKGLSYYDQFTNDLKYMSDTPLLEMDIAAQPAENLNNNDLVTITITLNNTGLDEVLICQLPNALRYEANSLSGTISPSAVYNPSTQTITWNGTIGAGKPTIQFQARLVQSPDPPVIHINLQHPSTARQISRDFLLPKRWIYLPLILFNRLEE